MVIDYALLGKRLASIRKKRGWTQERLAEKTNLANNYISNIENNRSIPSLETLVKLCEALGVTPNDLLLGSSQASDTYLADELTKKLRQCTPREKRILDGLLSLLISERDR